MSATVSQLQPVPPGYVFLDGFPGVPSLEIPAETQLLQFLRLYFCVRPAVKVAAVRQQVLSGTADFLRLWLLQTHYPLPTTLCLHCRHLSAAHWFPTKSVASPAQQHTVCTLGGISQCRSCLKASRSPSAPCNSNNFINFNIVNC